MNSKDCVLPDMEHLRSIDVSNKSYKDGADDQERRMPPGERVRWIVNRDDVLNQGADEENPLRVSCLPCHCRGPAVLELAANMAKS